MKKIKYFAIAFSVLAAGFVACEEDSDVFTGNENEGGLVTVDVPLVGYVVGNGVTKEYASGFTILQGDVRTESVDVYKSFTDTKGTLSPADDVTTAEVLLKNVPLSATSKREIVTYNVTYNELISGLTIGGNPLPASDAGLNVGDYWTLKYVSKTPNGDHANRNTTKVSVGTRFAGNYKVIEAEYYRIGVPRPDVAGPYVGTVVTIESVNSTTYKVNDWFGPFAGNEWYFTISPTDVIDYPATQPDGDPQVGNGIPMITCITEPAEMTHVHCGSSNFVTRDDVNGKDKLTMSFGYLNAPGASREFYQVLEKIVE